MHLDRKRMVKDRSKSKVTLDRSVGRLRAIEHEISDLFALAASGESKANTLGQEKLLNVAERILQWRRQRNRLLGHDVSFNPALDLVLNLYIRHVRNVDIALRRLITASGSSPLTAVRRLGLLEQHGLIYRCKDAADDRYVAVRLTPAGIDMAEKVLAEWERMLVPPFAIRTLLN